jgi:hypothetical protein
MYVCIWYIWETQYSFLSQVRNYNYQRININSPFLLIKNIMQYVEVCCKNFHKMISAYNFLKKAFIKNKFISYKMLIKSNL